MAPLKQKGDLAEMLVAADLVRRGYKVALPFGEDWDSDLIGERDGRLERVQVKYATSDGKVVAVRCYSVSLLPAPALHGTRERSRGVTGLARRPRSGGPACCCQRGGW
jgi:hypothetical protein